MEIRALPSLLNQLVMSKYRVIARDYVTSSYGTEGMIHGISAYYSIEENTESGWLPIPIIRSIETIDEAKSYIECLKKIDTERKVVYETD
jgi:hypothetical protein